MTKKIVVALIILVTIGAMTLWMTRDRDKTDPWKDKYDALVRVDTQLKIDNEADKEAYETKIGELNGMIDSSATIIADLEFKKATADKTIDRLALREKELRGEAELTLKSAKELIDNLTNSRDQWIAKFNLAEHQLAEAENINFAVSEKYEASVQRIVHLEGYVSEQKKLIDNLNTNWKICEVKKGRAKTWGTLKTVAIGCLSGYVAYKVVSK